MRCKILFNLCLVPILALTSLTSCKWIGEKGYTPKTIIVNEKRENCFEDFSGLIKSYFSATLPDNEIHGFFSCLEKSVDDFMRRTKERNPERGFSINEISSLIETFLLGTKEGPLYAERFMTIKRMFVGGDPQYFTRTEWKKVKTLLPVITTTMINTKPLTDGYYFFNDQSEYFSAIIKKQDDFLAHYNSMFDKFKQEGGSLSKSELLFIKDQIVSFDSLKKFKPVFDGLFDIYFSLQSSEDQKNWPQVFEYVEKALRVNAYIRRAKLERQVFAPSSAIYHALTIKSIISAVEFAQTLNWDNPIPQSEIEKVLLGLHGSRIIFKSVENTQDFLSVFAKVGQNTFSNQYEKKWVISTDDVLFFKYKYNVWVQSLVEVLAQYENSTFVSQYKELLYPDLKYHQDYEKVAKEIYNDIILKSHIINPSKGAFSYKVGFTADPKRGTLDQKLEVFSQFYQASLTNIALLLYDTYGKQKNVIGEKDKSITENTVDRIYRDIRPITMAEGLVSPLSCSSGARSFLEANLFSYSGNGDDKVDIFEGLQWFSSVVSASSTSREIYNDVIADGCAIPGLSKFQNMPYVDGTCFKNYLKNNFNKYYYHMPGFTKFISKPEDFERFYNKYFSIVRACKNFDLPLGYDEVVYATALLQYIETLFEVFDVQESEYYFFTREKNDVLEFSELWAAYNQRFYGVIKRLGEKQSGGELSDTVVGHIYRKLITDKKMPYTPDGTWDSIAWFMGSRSLMDPDPYTRMDIYEVFDSVLSTISNESKETTDYCQSVKLAWEEYKLNKVFSVNVKPNMCINEL